MVVLCFKPYLIQNKVIEKVPCHRRDFRITQIYNKGTIFKRYILSIYFSTLVFLSCFGVICHMQSLVRIEYCTTYYQYF